MADIHLQPINGDQQVDNGGEPEAQSKWWRRPYYVAAGIVLIVLVFSIFVWVITLGGKMHFCLQFIIASNLILFQFQFCLHHFLVHMFILYEFSLLNLPIETGRPPLLYSTMITIRI